MDKIKELVDKELKCIEETGTLNEQSLAALDKLVDIKKDIAEIEKMEESEEMRYYEDDTYGARRRDSRGRYMARGGRGSGRYSNYRMPDYFGKMQDGYEDYTEGMERYRAGGSYGDHDKGMEALEYMLEAVVDFVETLQEDAQNPEEVELIKKYVRKIKEM